ncbi:MAG: Mov34/MPN/PAD-1 family protein [Gemmataceae bacterium]
MLQALVSTATQWLGDFNRSVFRIRGPAAPLVASPHHRTISRYQPLRRIVLTDGVARTLFDEFAAHRKELRGEEETGWVLLGMREADEALVLATLPAGADRDASVAHVQFNTDAQALGSRIVRQIDRRLTILGVVHTHPGSLRHPSDADFRGDSDWVKNLRGGEGVFGIGTADSVPNGDALFAHQPRPNVQCLGELRLSWYSLQFGATGYRTVPLDLTIGPDLARPLHQVWPTIERHAQRLDRLASQQANALFEIVNEGAGLGLAMRIPLSEPYECLRVILREQEVQYLVEREGQVMAAQQDEERIDRGVYLLLAELAK